jgi:hypothetical protein
VARSCGIILFSVLQMAETKKTCFEFYQRYNLSKSHRTPQIIFEPTAENIQDCVGTP